MIASHLAIRKCLGARTPAFAGVVVALLAQSVAAAEPPATVLAQGSSGPLRCEIRKDEKGGMVELIGVAAGARPIAGKAHFELVKSGASGSSNIDQGQPFDVRADQQTIVGRATTNLAPGGHIAVDLRLQSDDGIECRAQASLER